MKTNKTLTDAIQTYLSNKLMLDTLEKVVKESKKVIEDFMDAADEVEAMYATETGDLFALKLSDITRTDINRKQLQDKYPEIFDDVKYETSYRRLNVTAKADVQVANAPVETKKTGVKKATAKSA